MDHTIHQDKSWKQKQIKLKMIADREAKALEEKSKPEPKAPVKYIKPVLSFKQLSEMGVVRSKLTKNLIKYNEVPQWMRDVWSAEKIGSEPTIELTPIVEEPAHEHGENCSHNE